MDNEVDAQPSQIGLAKSLTTSSWPTVADEHPLLGANLTFYSFFRRPYFTFNK